MEALSGALLPLPPAANSDGYPLRRLSQSGLSTGLSTSRITHESILGIGAMGGVGDAVFNRRLGVTPQQFRLNFAAMV